MLERMGVGEEPNPYVPYSPTSDIGMGGLAPSAADMAVMGQALVKQSQFIMPEMRQPPSIAFSPSSKQLFVNGLTFDADDAATALQSESYLRSPGTGLPVGGDWVSLDEQAYGQFLNSIKNPSMGRLASKSFGRGIDSMQMLAGRGLQLAGAEETVGSIVEQQAEDLRKTSPFERRFTDIGSAPNRGVVDWFVANFAQQGPNMIESVLTAGVGFLAGTATGGPLVGAGGALAGLMGKSAFKEAVIAAAKKKTAGEVLNAAEDKLLREAAGIAGAVTASYAQNLSTGAADIYGELRDQGANADDIDARLKALAGSLPYAILETVPEYLLAATLLRVALVLLCLPVLLFLVEVRSYYAVVRWALPLVVLLKVQQNLDKKDCYLAYQAKTSLAPRVLIDWLILLPQVLVSVALLVLLPICAVINLPTCLTLLNQPTQLRDVS
jgi:hypothetical protein